jgi:hypothetical protein
MTAPTSASPSVPATAHPAITSAGAFEGEAIGGGGKGDADDDCVDEDEVVDEDDDDAVGAGDTLGNADGVVADVGEGTVHGPCGHPSKYAQKPFVPAGIPG